MDTFLPLGLKLQRGERRCAAVIERLSDEEQDAGPRRRAISQQLDRANAGVEHARLLPPGEIFLSVIAHPLPNDLATVTSPL